MAAIIYPSQVQAVEEMLVIFAGEIRYVLFRAPLQSGKTGTYQYLIRQMLEQNMIDQAYIVCGSNEKQLLSQVERDVEEYHGAGMLNQTVHVVFRQHFKKITMATRRVLIVNDESHLDCEKDQQLNIFLRRHRLSMSGTTPFMQQNQIYMVSVSATPFAEESVLVHGDSLPKAMVRLVVDPNEYYGPMDYYRDGLLHPTFSVLTAEGESLFRNKVQEVWGRNKYVVIRIRESAVRSRQAKRQAIADGQLSHTNAEGVLELIQDLVRTTPGARILRFTSQYNKDRQQVAVTQEESDAHFLKYRRRIPSLDMAPMVPTVVLLDGRLRCGKRLHKAYIGMVWDTASQSSTEVIFQGLLGRMCGYRGGEYGQVPLAREDRPVIYTNSTLFQTERDATIQLSDLDRFDAVGAVEATWHGLGVGADGLPNVVPHFANHLRRVDLEKQMRRAQTGTLVHQCAPLRFQLSADAVEQLTVNLADSEVRRLCWEAFVPQLVELVDVNQDLTLMQRMEIRDWVEASEARDSHVRRYQGGSNHNMYQHMVQAYLARTGVEKDRIGDGHFLTFCVVFHGFACEDPVGTVYVSIYTQASGFTRVIPLSSRVAPHDGKTHFIRGLEPVEEEEEKAPVAVVAAARYGFTPEIEGSPAEFENQLDYFIRVTQAGVGHFGQVFTSIGNKNGIHLLRAAYGDDLSVLRMAIERLEATHGVRIRYVRSRAMTQTHLLLRSIQWE